MSDAKEFCTCTDFSCPFNPANHEEGCTACIEKCLRAHELPSCFFRDLGYPKTTEGWRYEDFAKVVMERKAAEEGRTGF